METGLIQTLAAGVIVIASALFLVRRAWRTVGGTKRRVGDDEACGASEGCGCGNVAARGAAPDVVDARPRI